MPDQPPKKPDDGEIERSLGWGCYAFVGLMILATWLLIKLVAAAAYGVPLLGFP